MVEHQQMKGTLTITVRDRNGAVREELRVRNLITNKGRAMVGSLFGQPGTYVSKMAIAVGEDGSEPAKDDTKLGKPFDLAPATAKPGASANVILVEAKLTMLADSAARRELREAGIIVTVKTGTSTENYLYNRVTFGVVTQTSSTDISLSWEVTF